jgi:hypothetical protein
LQKPCPEILNSAAVSSLALDDRGGDSSHSSCGKIDDLLLEKLISVIQTRNYFYTKLADRIFEEHSEKSQQDILFASVSSVG